MWLVETYVTCAFFGLKILLGEIPLLFIALAIAGTDRVRYYADEDGVEFRRGISKRYISYEDITSVTIVTKPCGHAKFGGTFYKNELTIKTVDRKFVYRESCGVIYSEDILERPADVEMQLHENELSWLAEYIKERI